MYMVFGFLPNDAHQTGSGIHPNDSRRMRPKKHQKAYNFKRHLRSIHLGSKYKSSISVYVLILVEIDVPFLVTIKIVSPRFHVVFRWFRMKMLEDEIFYGTYSLSFPSPELVGSIPCASINTFLFPVISLYYSHRSESNFNFKCSGTAQSSKWRAF